MTQLGYRHSSSKPYDQSAGRIDPNLDGRKRKARPTIKG